MKNPATLLKNKIYVPLYNIKKTYLNKGTLKHACRGTADFIFNFSKETALIMLVFNAVSVISSHLSQIGGLKKSDRENKDYLITQEKKELGLDLGLTIIPPFLINNMLMKKIDSGEITTRSAEDKLKNVIAPAIGASTDDLYSTDHIVPVKEQFLSLADKIVSTISEQKKLPQGLKDKLKSLDEKFDFQGEVSDSGNFPRALIFRRRN